jgi:hypothetical protein
MIQDDAREGVATIVTWIRCNLTEDWEGSDGELMPRVRLLGTEFSTPPHEHGHGPFPPFPLSSWRLGYLFSSAEKAYLFHEPTPIPWAQAVASSETFYSQFLTGR